MTTNPLVDNSDWCVVPTHLGARITPGLSALLDPVDPASLHEYRLPARSAVELHGHNYDEYWWFISGSPRITLWTAERGCREYQAQPGDLIVCVRGMAHTLFADEELIYHQFSSIPRPGARPGHLSLAELNPKPACLSPHLPGDGR